MPSKMLYPNKHTPTGWRIQDKVLKVNRVFTVARYGSLAQAEAAAMFAICACPWR